MESCKWKVKVEPVGTPEEQKRNYEKAVKFVVECLRKKDRAKEVLNTKAK